MITSSRTKCSLIISGISSGSKKQCDRITDHLPQFVERVTLRKNGVSERAGLVPTLGDSSTAKMISESIAAIIQARFSFNKLLGESNH